VRRVALLALLAPLLACSSREGSPDAGPLGAASPALAASGSASAPAASALVLDEPPEPGAPAPLPPTPPKGMVWVPPGILLAGTPEGRLPRVADEEMPGAQVVMRGFFIDELPYPNEAGAIPVSNVTQLQAAELCERQSRRLCTELEWERACKGPQNFVYPYGDSYHPADCGTGVNSSSIAPVGVLAQCRSGFGVRDLHGSVWQWTSSPWGRGTLGNLVTLRGGTGQPGEVFSRCANARARRPTEAQPTAGFRCCAGDRNLAEVAINLVTGDSLTPVAANPAWQAALVQSPPPGMATFIQGATFRILSTWRWRPIGNEEIILQSGCANPGALSACGIAVARLKNQTFEPLGFASSGWWIAALKEDQDPRDLYVYGGDKDGGFRRHLGYSFGRVVVGEPERNIKKKRKRGKSAPGE
jgi:hypothetical protein